MWENPIMMAKIKSTLPCTTCVQGASGPTSIFESAGVKCSCPVKETSLKAATSQGCKTITCSDNRSKHVALVTLAQPAVALFALR